MNRRGRGVPVGEKVEWFWVVTSCLAFLVTIACSGGSDEPASPDTSVGPASTTTQPFERFTDEEYGFEIDVPSWMDSEVGVGRNWSGRGEAMQVSSSPRGLAEALSARFVGFADECAIGDVEVFAEQAGDRTFVAATMDDGSMTSTTYALQSGDDAWTLDFEYRAAAEDLVPLIDAIVESFQPLADDPVPIADVDAALADVRRHLPDCDAGEVPLSLDGTDRWSISSNLGPTAYSTWAGEGFVLVDVDSSALLNGVTDTPIPGAGSESTGRELRLVDLSVGTLVAEYQLPTDEGRTSIANRAWLGIGAPLAVDVSDGVRPASGLQPEVPFVRLALVDVEAGSERWAIELDPATNPSFGEIDANFGAVYGVTGDAVVVTSDTDRNVVTALSTDDGSILWQREGGLPPGGLASDGRHLLMYRLGEFTNNEGFAVVDVATGADVVSLDPPGEAWLFDDNSYWLSSSTYLVRANDGSTLIGKAASGAPPIILRDGERPSDDVLTDDVAAYTVTQNDGLTAIDLESGSVIWSVPIPDSSERRPEPIAIAGGRLIVNIRGGDPHQVGIYALDTGEEVGLIDGEVASTGRHLDGTYLWYGTYTNADGDSFGAIRAIADDSSTIIGVDEDGEPITFAG